MLASEFFSVYPINPPDKRSGIFQKSSSFRPGEFVSFPNKQLRLLLQYERYGEAS